MLEITIGPNVWSTKIVRDGEVLKQVTRVDVTLLAGVESDFTKVRLTHFDYSGDAASLPQITKRIEEVDSRVEPIVIRSAYE